MRDIWDPFLRFLKDNMFLNCICLNSPTQHEGIKYLIRQFCEIHAFLYKQHFFSSQSQCCLMLSFIELQILLSCCLTHIGIIILRHFLYLLYLCSCLDIGLFMSYLCNLFFIFIFILQTSFFFCLFFRICTIIFWMITWMKNVNNFQMPKVQPQGVA